MLTAKSLRIANSFGLEHVELHEHETARPGAGEVLVELTAASLNYRDLMVATGVYNPKMPLPRVLGSDAAGTVAAVGEGVTRFKPGDRVATLFFQGWHRGEITNADGKTALGGPIDGAFTTRHTFPETGLIAVPDHLTDAEAATLPCAALTAWHALVEKGRLAAGETVLILGTGGVSLFALQIAKLHSARVIVTSSSDEKLERVRSLGADETINYKTNPDWDKAARELTGGAGVDHVVEVGGAGTFSHSLNAVRTAGHVYVIGVLSGATQQLDIRLILGKSLHVEGVYVGSSTMFERMNSAFTKAKLKPVIDRHFSLAQGRDALAHLQSGSHFGKLVLDLA